MKLINEPIKGLYVLEPQVFKDERGYFFESFSKQKINDLGLNIGEFVQSNESMSSAGVVRGLHFQNPPYAQGKLVRVIKGAVLDVAVDIRKSSPTYGQHFALELSEENKLMMYIPEGFAHGFATLKDHTIFAYSCTNYYNKESEGGILWNDSILNIDWKLQNPTLSEKDKVLPKLADFESLFN